jgi:hypothetical protein
MAGAIVDLSHGMAEMRLTMQSVLNFLNPTPQQFGVPPHQPALPPPHPVAPTSYPYGMPTDAGPATAPLLPSTGVPLHLLRFPPSPSQIPAWALGHSGPAYTMTPPLTHVPDQGAPVASSTLFGGMDGTLFHGSNVVPTATSAPGFNEGGQGGGAPASAQGNGPPKFHKIEFTTYDGSVDPLNWLTHCEQFFRGQFTPAS